MSNTNRTSLGIIVDVLTLVDGYIGTQEQELLLAYDGGVMTWSELRRHIDGAIHLARGENLPLMEFALHELVAAGFKPGKEPRTVSSDGNFGGFEATVTIDAPHFREWLENYTEQPAAQHSDHPPP